MCGRSGGDTTAGPAETVVMPASSLPLCAVPRGPSLRTGRFSGSDFTRFRALGEPVETAGAPRVSVSCSEMSADAGVASRTDVRPGGDVTAPPLPSPGHLRRGGVSDATRSPSSRRWPVRLSQRAQRIRGRRCLARRRRLTWLRRSRRQGAVSLSARSARAPLASAAR